MNQQNVNNWKYVLHEPKLSKSKIAGLSSDPISYASEDKSFVGMSFFDYVTAIDNYPDKYFDIILIDGRARPSCFKHSINKIKQGGYIILDNAERAEYSPIEELAKSLGFLIEEYWGPGPYNPYCWRTIFMKASQ